MIVRLGDGAMLRGESRLNIGEELPRRKGALREGEKTIYGGSLRKPTVGFILLLLQGMMTELGRVE